MSYTRISRTSLCATLFALMLAFVAKPVHGQLVLKNEDVSVKFGFQGQFWMDSTQDPTTQGYAQNLYMRRIRLLMGGQLAKDLTFFFQTDDPNLGKSTSTANKALGTGFIVQDAFLEWAISKKFRLDGGLMLVPLSRNTLQSTLSYYTLDISPITTVNNTSTQSSGLRDAGFQARGFFMKDHLLYRLGLFEGERAPATIANPGGSSRNSLRTAGYLQYDFFDTETAYTFVGTALGKQKILAVDGGFDTQGKYRALSANIATAIPVHGGDEIGGQYQFIHYDGRTQFTAIANQNDSRKIKLQPFAKFEAVNFVQPTKTFFDTNRVGGGVNYYVHAQNLKFTALLQRVFPQNVPTKSSNEFTLQMQVFYY